MKKILIGIMLCCLLVGCSTKKEEGSKKETSYIPQEVQKIFERNGYSVTLPNDEVSLYGIVNENTKSSFVYLVLTNDRTYKYYLATFKDTNEAGYDWINDAINSDGCEYNLKTKKSTVGKKRECEKLDIEDGKEIKKVFEAELKRLNISEDELTSLFEYLEANR